MSEDRKDRRGSARAEERAKRLAQALRANLRRRKAQARERSRSAEGDTSNQEAAERKDAEEGCS